MSAVEPSEPTAGSDGTPPLEQSSSPILKSTENRSGAAATALPIQQKNVYTSVKEFIQQGAAGAPGEQREPAASPVALPEPYMFSPSQPPRKPASHAGSARKNVDSVVVGGLEYSSKALFSTMVLKARAAKRRSALAWHRKLRRYKNRLDLLFTHVPYY